MKNDEKKESRPSKWYDSPLNSYIREQIEKKVKSADDFAQKLGVTVEAVRQWCAGYSRPDIDKLPTIASYFKVSTDFILGVTTTKSPNLKTRAVCEYTGLNEEFINFCLIAKEAHTAPRGDINSYHPGIKITIAGHKYDGFLDIINNLFVHQLEDVERMLSSIKRYDDAMNASEKIRKEITDNCGIVYDKRYGTQTHEPSRDDYISAWLDRYDEAVEHGESSTIYKFDVEQTHTIRYVRAARLDVNESIYALIESFTKERLKRLSEQKPEEVSVSPHEEVAPAQQESENLLLKAQNTQRAEVGLPPVDRLIITAKEAAHDGKHSET